MRPVDDVDDWIEQVLNHLRDYSAGDAPKDSQLMSDFQDSLQFGPGDLMIKDPLDNPVVGSLVSLLYRIVASNRADPLYEDTLVVILGKMPFYNVVKYFPPDVIVDYLLSPETTLAALVLKVLAEHIASGAPDPELVLFLQEKHVAQSVAQRVFGPSDISGLMKFLTEWIASSDFVFRDSDWHFLLNYSSDFLLSHYTYISAYLRLLESFARFANNDDFLSSLTTLDYSSLMHADDTLLEASVIEALKPIVESYPFDPMRPGIHALLQHRFDLARDGRCEKSELHIGYEFLFFFLNSKIVALREFGEDFLQRNPDILNFDLLHSEYQNVFWVFPLHVIKDKQAFFDKHFGDYQIGRINQNKLFNVIHLMEDRDFFEILKKSGIISADALKPMPADLLFTMFDFMAKHEWTVAYLVNDLAYFVQKYLITPDRSLVNPTVWESKKRTLLLLLEGNWDLGVWRGPLTDCYREMLLGRSLRNIEPQVDVTDLAM